MCGACFSDWKTVGYPTQSHETIQINHKSKSLMANMWDMFILQMFIFFILYFFSLSLKVSSSDWKTVGYPTQSHETHRINHKSFMAKHLKYFYYAKYVQHIFFSVSVFKLRIFWEGHKNFRNLHLTFVYSTYRQK